MRLARAAMAELGAQVERHGIDCDWSRDGKYHAAVSPRGVREVLKPFVAELEALKEPYEWVEGEALAARLGTRHFTAAVYTPGNVLMNPAALTRGLADSLPGNVTLYENSPVREADFRNGVRFETAGGTLRAPKMILAANGFSEQFGFYPGRFMHLAAHGSLTRPLTEAERAAYGVEKPWGLTPANAFAGITMRYTNDHRILIRYGARLLPLPARHARAAGEDAPPAQGAVRRALPHAEGRRDGAHLDRLRLPLAQRRAGLRPTRLECLERGLPERRRRGVAAHHRRRRAGDLRPGQT
jgi:glycine/D-amino acid oxidase-like deaminating enzyme